jgi:hypothetical protein
VDGDVHTNTIEGFFSTFKNGVRGVFVALLCGLRVLGGRLVFFGAGLLPVTMCQSVMPSTARG